MTRSTGPASPAAVRVQPNQAARVRRRPGRLTPARSLARLRATAVAAINTHVNDHGRCRACGGAYPCVRARQAELALGLF